MDENVTEQLDLVRLNYIIEEGKKIVEKKNR